MVPIEEMVFARKRWIEDRMLSYGFHKTKKIYTLEKPFLNGDFKAILSVTLKGQVTGKVIDSMTQDEYYQLRQEAANGPYVNKVRSAYAALLTDIANSCCGDVLFASPQANRLTQTILKRFQVKPDFPWEHSSRYQSYGCLLYTSDAADD